MEAPQFQLLRGDGIVRFSKRLCLAPLSRRVTMSRPPWRLDFVAAIFYRGQKRPCDGLGSVRALASIQGLLPVQERKSNGAVELSRDTSNRLSRCRDLLSGSTDAAAAGRFPEGA